MLIKHEIRRLRRLINDYVSARIESSHMGGMDPDSWPEIRQRVTRTRAAMNQYIEKVSRSIHADAVHNSAPNG